MISVLLLLPLVCGQWFPPPGGAPGGGGGLFGKGGLLSQLLPPNMHADVPNNPQGASGDKGGNNALGNNLANDLKKLLNQGGAPPQREWEQHARRFCQQYPQHPKCSGGKLPQYSELQQIINAVGQSVRKMLPMIPRLNIRDPLQGVPNGLAGILEESFKTVGFITQKIRSDLLGACKKVNCLASSPEDLARRNLVKSKILNFEKSVFGKDTSNDLELRLQRTRQVKQALLDKANLTGQVAAADDGVFDKDILLTTEQANWLLNDLGKGGVTEDEPLPPGGKRKRAALFLEEQPIKKWDLSTPIRYTFHESLEEWDKNDVRAALAEITKNAPCIKFVYTPNVPNGPHLNYMKVDSPSFCGLSYIGRNDPANPIYLSFACGNAKGVAIHETMHALGVNHQHLRMDRDQHILVDWSNINPQHYDVFAVADAKLYSSYGVQYDYASIMHYNAYTAAVDFSKPTMIPKVNQQANIGVLGQRDRMTTNDILLLKKMYCMPNCVDTNVYCGAWALKDLCNSAGNGIWMKANCKKSCNVC